MFKLFQPCTSSTNQIKPSQVTDSAAARYVNDDSSLQDKDEEEKLSDRLKLKPQLNFDDDKSTNKSRKFQKSSSQKHQKGGHKEENSSSSQSNLEKEMYLFSCELHWKEGDIHNYQYQLLNCQNKPFIYYECNSGNTMNLTQIRSPLVIVLRNILMNKPIAYNKQSIQTLLSSSLSSLNELLKLYEQSSNILFISSALSASEMNYFKQFTCFVSIEHTFMTAVSFIFLLFFLESYLSLFICRMYYWRHLFCITK
jgi:hypothetical protein